jgi:hypothetical protein
MSDLAMATRCAFAAHSSRIHRAFYRAFIGMGIEWESNGKRMGIAWGSSGNRVEFAHSFRFGMGFGMGFIAACGWLWPGGCDMWASHKTTSKRLQQLQVL